MTSRIVARLGVVDRDRGSALPQALACKAIILKKSPGPDGLDFDTPDIVSVEAVAITMSNRAGALRPDDDFAVKLKHGIWDRLHLCLVDDNGAVFAMGALYAIGAKMLNNWLVGDHDGVFLAPR